MNGKACSKSRRATLPLLLRKKLRLSSKFRLNLFRIRASRNFRLRAMSQWRLHRRRLPLLRQHGATTPQRNFRFRLRNLPRKNSKFRQRRRSRCKPLKKPRRRPKKFQFRWTSTSRKRPKLRPRGLSPKRKRPSRKLRQPESEFEVEQDYELVLEPEALVPAHDQRPPETPIVPRQPEPVAQNAASGMESDQFLADLANEIDQLGIDELSPAFSTPAAQQHEAPANTNRAAAGEPEVSQIEVGPLKEVFDEFRAELGEMGGEEEDLETHYNLGIAFREMGLLDEAISEFQKVAKAAENGRKFPYVMQCYTLLGLAFMDRAQPSIAAMWYERALRLPGVEPESVLALRYDLGVAQESAGESNAALKSFSQVYAVNIDYRDVGERIAALQKTTR